MPLRVFAITYDPVSNKIVISRDVLFDETRVGDFKSSSTPLIDHSFFSDLFPSTDEGDSLDIVSPIQSTTVDPPASSFIEPDLDSQSGDISPGDLIISLPTSPVNLPAPTAGRPLSTTPTEHSRPPPRRSSRMKSAPYKLVKDNHVFMTELAFSGVNSMYNLITLDGQTKNISLSEALRDSRWSEAIQAEPAALKKNHTWDLVRPPPGTKPLSAKWVLKIKSDSDPSHTRFKARLVAKGYE